MKPARFCAFIIVSALAESILFPACAGKQTVLPLSARDLIWVQRPDGTVTCRSQPAEDLHSVGLSLSEAGVHVAEAQKGHDHLEHDESCGKPTGSLNLFRIPLTDLPIAQKQGFQELSIPKVSIEAPSVK